MLHQDACSPPLSLLTLTPTLTDCQQHSYGPTATDKSLNALVCSSESALNAALVNRLRQQNNMSTLQLVAVQRTSAVSSTLERAQEAHLDLCHKLDSLKL